MSVCVCVCVEKKIKNYKTFGNGLVSCHVEHRLYLATVSYLHRVIQTGVMMFGSGPVVIERLGIAYRCVQQEPSVCCAF